jgi:hypothetical protein
MSDLARGLSRIASARRKTSADTKFLPNHLENYFTL